MRKSIQLRNFTWKPRNNQTYNRLNTHKYIKRKKDNVISISMLLSFFTSISVFPIEIFYMCEVRVYTALKKYQEHTGLKLWGRFSAVNIEGTITYKVNGDYMEK